MFLFRVAILNPARKVSQEEPSRSWILAAGKDTQKELDRSFCRRWATSLGGASGRMRRVGTGTLVVWVREAGRREGECCGARSAFSPLKALTLLSLV